MSGVQVDLTTFEQIIEAEDIAPPCDCLVHQQFGSGSAAWVLRWASDIKPCGCVRAANPALFCAPCKDYQIMLTNKVARCMRCDDRHVTDGPISIEALS